MNKSKIAISIGNEVLSLVDEFMEKSTLTSRSQAIEHLINKAINKDPPTKAVLLIRDKDQKFLFEEFAGKTLLEHHAEFLRENGIQEIFLVTKTNEDFNASVFGILKPGMIEIVDEGDAKGTAAALNVLRSRLNGNFIVINADTFNDFNIKKMISQHLNNNNTATIGLISAPDPENRGSVVLDGHYIVSFAEKQATSSNIVSAGIYVLNSRIFSTFTENTKSLEIDVFPLLAQNRTAQGFFTFGRFFHAPDKMMEIPLAELLDRFSIMKLKMERIGDPYLKGEFDSLQKGINKYKDRGIDVKEDWLTRLYDTNAKMWDLEHDIRKGKEGELGLEEVGRRALAIRDLNKQRVSIKNEITDATGFGFRDVKMNHASQ